MMRGQAAQPPKCPECGSHRAWKDGLRETVQGPVQRWICRQCGYRFSTNGFTSLKKNVEILNTQGLKPFNRQVCVLAEDSKNLAETARLEQAAGATTDQAITQGLIVQYMAYLENEGYKADQYLKLIKMLAKRGADLRDPENVKAVIAKQPWKDGSKILAVYAYDAMTRMLGITWNPPKGYTQEEALPWIPEEAELDALIASCRSKRMAAYLETLKRTFADPGEALRLRWIDVDSSNSTITINQPVKGHRPRQLQVPSKLIAMLNALPKTSERIFPTNYTTMAAGFRIIRNKAADKLQNPRLRNISLTTFRHWGATMTYYYTRKILLVQQLLGHKRIENTLKYTKLIQFKDDEFDVETATTVEEAKSLLKAGFDYITEKNDIMLFRRPKRFGPSMAPENNA